MADTNQQSPLPSKRTRRPSRYDRNNLPTPPPDPVEDKHQDPDREVLDYLESLHKSYERGISVSAPAVAAEEAFDHLERLYNLMEQMLELREQNGRLHRRVRDLEHLHNMEKMHKKLEELGDQECPELDKDTIFAETILESILQDAVKKKNIVPARTRHSILRRNRSASCVEATPVEEQGGSEKQSKVSKWTKVKAAFKWEKALNNVVETKTQECGGGFHVPVNMEIARYLRVPSISDDNNHSPVDSGAGISTPGSLSTASSNEDFQRADGRIRADDLRSSDDESNQHYIPCKDETSSKPVPKYLHPHRTRWSKMKDIIQTKGSFKKKHRLSAASDDIQIDVELCSDNEEVFEDENKASSSQISSTPSPNPHSVYSRLNSTDIPKEIIERYQRAFVDDTSSDGDKKTSKWTRVKKAFIASEHKDDTTDDEIQRSYRQLQKKLSLEFQERLTEWDKLKQGYCSAPNPSTSSSNVLEDSKDAEFMKKIEEWEKIKNQSPTSKQRSLQAAKEIGLPPDFKKKLQEWEKIKKTTACSKKRLGEIPKWKSISGNRTDNSQGFEYPVITDDFRKKLEEWKEIKARGEANWTNFEQKMLQDKTPSPKLTRKTSGGKAKKQDKELHWFEKELGKIEKEKQRLERERQKFLEREERLSKLRKAVAGGVKKEVLVHTPCGMYRFEGISRKFTQKLYEWEKAQGIAPEASTFAFLSACSPQSASSASKCEKDGTPPITRSKSADSVAISPNTLTCPIISKQPSSLSLNDVENLEKECMADSKSSSMQFLMEAEDPDEPEAVLVEVEDYEEETASPLKTFSSKREVPVYQRQETRALCEGEMLVAPKVHRSESTKAQTNYSLIEDIVTLLRILVETELEIKGALQMEGSDDEKKERLEKLNDSQKLWASKMSQKLFKLQEANGCVATNIAKEEEELNNHVVDILEAVQDLSAELLQLSETLEGKIAERSSEEAASCYSGDVFELIEDMKCRMLQLRRHLSYVCAASDLTAPTRKKSWRRVRKTQSNESRCDTTTSDSREGSQRSGRFIKSENANISSQGAVKKRIRYRQKSLQRNITDTDEEDEDDEQKKNVRQHKKLTRTRSISESGVQQLQEASSDANLEYSMLLRNQAGVLPDDSPVTVFVKTTRKLFTPIAEARSLQKTEENLEETKEEQPASPKADNPQQRPPLPASPIPQRKVYKVSPGIRMMMAKYNQKIDGDGTKSPGSSGSNSPLWRSPTSERRVRAQTEKYQEEILKLSPSLGERPKSRSDCCSLVSTSSTPGECCKKAKLVLELPSGHSPEIRQKKLQQAKEEFLKSSPVSAPPQVNEEPLKFPERNRLSQISVDSGSSFGSVCMGALIKSASAGMINIDADTYRQIDPEYHGDGYVSLPRSTRKLKEGLLGGKFAFSSIASKFRKVRMRRGKEREKDGSKIGAVSTLCRQSLVVDIAEASNNNNRGEGMENEEVASRGVVKSDSWIKRAMLFRK